MLPNTRTSLVSNSAAANDLIIAGTYVLQGKTPVLNVGALVQVSGTGTVRVDNNTNIGESDDFAYNIVSINSTRECH